MQFFYNVLKPFAIDFTFINCTRVYQKLPRLDLQTRMYLFDLSLGSIPFKTVPLCSNTSIPAPLPLLERVLEVLFPKRTKNILRFPLDLLHSVKAVTL